MSDAVVGLVIVFASVGVFAAVYKTVGWCLSRFWPRVDWEDEYRNLFAAYQKEKERGDRWHMRADTWRRHATNAWRVRPLVWVDETDTGEDWKEDE